MVGHWKAAWCLSTHEQTQAALVNTPRQTLFWLILALGPLPPARGGRAQSISLPSPAQASGLWEASDGEGGAVGIELLLTTLVNGRALRLVDTKQQRQSLAAKVFHRTTPELKSGQANSFVDSPETPLDTDGQTLRLSWGKPERSRPRRASRSSL